MTIPTEPYRDGITADAVPQTVADAVGDLFTLARTISLPTQAKKNAIRALAQGVAGLLISDSDAQKKWLQTNEQAAEQIAASTLLNRSNVALAESGPGHNDLYERAANYYSTRAVMEQRNREHIMYRALLELQRCPPRKDAGRNIDSDWLTDFWRVAETRGRETMQTLLAKLLVQELIYPGNIYPRDLNLLVFLSDELLQRYHKFCRLSIDDGREAYIILAHGVEEIGNGPLAPFGIGRNDLLEFSECGLLISPEACMMKPMRRKDAKFIDYAGQAALLQDTGHELWVLYLNRVGRLLRRLTPLRPLQAYTKALQQKFGYNFLTPEVGAD